MPHRAAAHVLDAVVVGTVSVLAAATPLLAVTGDAQADNEMRLLLLPLIGAVLASGGLIMLNPNPETRRITIGRSIFGLLVGVISPQIIGMLHPALADLALRPMVLVAAGAVFAALAFVLSRPFTSEFYARAEGIARREAERLEEKYSPPMTRALKANTEATRANTEQRRRDVDDALPVVVTNNDQQKIPVELVANSPENPVNTTDAHVP